MTTSEQFGKFEIKISSNGDRLVFEHLPTSETYSFEDGTFSAPEQSVERFSLGTDGPAESFADIGGGATLIESPNGHVQAVELQDSANSESGANEYSEIAEYVTSEQTITIYRWGGFVLSDDTQTAGTALEVSLLQQDGTVVKSATTADNSSTAGVASYSPASDEVVRMRLTNTLGEDVDSASGFFGYEVS